MKACKRYLFGSERLLLTIIKDDNLELGTFFHLHSYFQEKTRRSKA